MYLGDLTTVVSHLRADRYTTVAHHFGRQVHNCRSTPEGRHVRNCCPPLRQAGRQVHTADRPHLKTTMGGEVGSGFPPFVANWYTCGGRIVTPCAEAEILKVIVKDLAVTFSNSIL